MITSPRLKTTIERMRVILTEATTLIIEPRVVEAVPTTISRAVIDEVLAAVHAGVVSREPRS